MKKYLFLIIATLFIVSSCKGKEAPPDEPAPLTTNIPGVGEVNIVSDDDEDIYGDDPYIEYIDGDAELDLVQNEEDFVVTNSFLGVTFKIPEGWFYWFMDTDNLRADPSLTLTEDKLSLTQDETTGEIYADFFDIGNNDDEYSDGHLGIAARAVRLGGMTAEKYLEAFKEANLMSDAVSLVHEGAAEFNGVVFTRLVFFVLNPYDEYDSRILDTFSIERNGYLIMIKFEAWASYPENEREMMAYMQFYVEVR